MTFKHGDFRSIHILPGQISSLMSKNEKVTKNSSLVPSSIHQLIIFIHSSTGYIFKLIVATTYLRYFSTKIIRYNTKHK